MKKIAVITDTDSSLPRDIAAQYGIRQVPITVHFDEETFRTGIDIDDKQLFEMVDRLNRLPTTSAPSPGAFIEAFQEAFDDGADDIACICVSSKVSATYAAAVTACEHFPDRTIRVIDSSTLSLGQGFMAIEAAQAVKEGASMDEVVARSLDVGSRLHIYAVLATLKYLALSGRVGKLVAGMADTLNIKPILTVQDGKLDLLERVRSRKKAIERMFELVVTAVDGKGIEKVGIIHGNHLQGALELQSQLCEKFPCPEDVIIAEFTAGLSVHAGSGVVGIVILTS
jgi:DegV family protein with EDD domain